MASIVLASQPKSTGIRMMTAEVSERIVTGDFLELMPDGRVRKSMRRTKFWALKQAEVGETLTISVDVGDNTT